MTKKICALTMARNDEFFLTRWVDYYGRHLGKENLYILLDGEDQEPPANAVGTTVVKYPREDLQLVSAEKNRLWKLSQYAEGLLKRYDVVIGTDADEFLVVDPDTGKTLAEYLGSIKIGTCLSGLGLDVGQNTNNEPVLDLSRPFLEQRGYALVSTRYTKPSIITKPVTWGAGFHRVKGHNFHIDKNLYLFHFGCVDLKMAQDRFKDADRMKAGWEKHMQKRIRTITMVSGKKAHNPDTYLPLARRIQRVVRPPYAWNKPAMFGWRLVVQIPDRLRREI